jgi:hypothetical protein
MAKLKFKEKVTDDMQDALDIIKSTGRMLQDGKIDFSSILHNLAEAIAKLESAMYYINRD